MLSLARSGDMVCAKSREPNFKLILWGANSPDLEGYRGRNKCHSIPPNILYTTFNFEESPLSPYRLTTPTFP